MRTPIFSAGMAFAVQRSVAETDIKCNYSLEVMFTQDGSISFKKDMKVLKNKLPELINDLLREFPGSRFGFTSFVDKPLVKMGRPPEGGWFKGDYCYDVLSPISAEPIEPRIEQLVTRPLGGGYDWPENQLGVLHDLAKNDRLTGWSSRKYDDLGRPIVRVLIMSTDAVYHISGDGSKSPHRLRPNDGSMETDCLTEDYPSIRQVGSALRERGIYTIFLLSKKTTEDLLLVYQELLETMQVPGATHPLESDSSDIVTESKKAFVSLTDLVCLNGTADVAFVQDVTYSYKNDMPLLHDAAKDVVKHNIRDFIFPRWAFATFADKPFAPFGDAPSGDYCYRSELAGFTSDPLDIATVIHRIETTSGLDWKESQLDAIMSTVLDPKIEWRTGNEWNGFKLRRYVILATDSGYHLAGDATNLQPHRGGITTCSIDDYPTVEQLAKVLKETDVHPIFVPTSDIRSIYHRLNNLLKDVYGIIGYVVELKDFANLPDAVVDGIRKLQSILDSQV